MKQPPSCSVMRVAPVWALLCLTLAVPVVARSQRAARVPATVSVSTSDRVVFRVDLDEHRLEPGNLADTERLIVRGFETGGEPGQPATPQRRFMVALPPSGGYRVNARVLTSEDLGTRRLEPVPFPVGIDGGDDLGPVISQRYELDRSIYEGYQAPPTVEALETGYVRRQRVLPLLVHPVSYDPSSGKTVLATAIKVTVTFEGGAEASRRAPEPESPIWDDVFARAFVNSGQARQWRRDPLVEPLARPAPRAVVQGTRVKLRVYSTGIHRVSAAEATAAGFPPAQPLSSLHLFRRTYDEDFFTAGVVDVAYTVEEGAGGTAGVFDGDDNLIFYGRGLRDDAAQGDQIRKFSDYNIYWLGTTSGPTMATRAAAPGYVSADTASASFVATRHFETDAFFEEDSPVGTTDFYQANQGTNAGPIDQGFRVGAMRPGSQLTLRAELTGSTYRTQRTIRLSMTNSLGTVLLAADQSIPNKTRLVFEAPVNASSVVDGQNVFRMELPTNTTRGGVEVLLNWVDVSYPSLYRARGSALEFDSATLSGDTSLTVTGLTTTDVRLYDVSDPDAPVALDLDAGNFSSGAGGGYALSFRENLSVPRRYVVTPVSRMTEITAGDIEADAPSNLIGGTAESGVDVLVVSHQSFMGRMQQWVTYRRAQGYKVLMTDVVDVFDEFNNGVPHARAIDRFTRHFFEMGNASVLVLVGDSSEDNRTVESTSAPNFVPTHSWPDHVGVLNEDEVVTTDKRYVKFPGPGGIVDRYPDMIVGRIPVGDDLELQKVLAKIFLFEKPRADDFWRKRMIVVADDAYSGGGSVFGGSQLCYFGSERAFETGQESLAGIMEGSPPAGYDVIRFFQREYTDAIHQENCVNIQTAVDYVRSNVTERLMGELAQGATLVAIQAHMNRRQITHEKLLTTEGGLLPGGLSRDHLRMGNVGRPWIIFGLGCHFSDYAIHKELERVLFNRPNGDTFAEQLLFANNAGAVGTYGSAGFEYLGQTNTLMNITGRVWFYDAPYDTMVNQTQAEWVFGKLMYLVENEAADSQQYAVERYHILGDPLLRIDAGPPAFDVTVNGAPFISGGAVTTGGADGDSVHVEAVVTDENAINDFALTIDGQNRTGDLSVEQLLDPQLASGRQYRLRFAHKLQPRTYDIVLNAFQAPDTSGEYNMAGEFLLRVVSSVSVTVNGRVVQSGATIPSRSDFLVEVSLPVFVPSDSVSVSLDDTPVTDIALSHPAPEDSTTWLIRFSRSLQDGSHELVVRAGSANEFRYELQVSSAVGLRHVMNYPNPFRDATSFIYDNDVEISDGRIDIFTVSGKRIRRLDIPPTSSQPGQNAVYWDGRDHSGGTIANGVYLYVITVTQRGKSSTVRGKLARIE